MDGLQFCSSHSIDHAAPLIARRSGEGRVDVFEARNTGFHRLAQVATISGARTGLFVPELDRLFLAARAGWIEPASTWVLRPDP